MHACAHEKQRHAPLRAEPGPRYVGREFKRSEDMYAQDSIHLLEVSGIDFAQMEARGIEVYRFGEILMSSGIVLNDEARRMPPSNNWHGLQCVSWAFYGGLARPFPLQRAAC